MIVKKVMEMENKYLHDEEFIEYHKAIKLLMGQFVQELQFISQSNIQRHVRKALKQRTYKEYSLLYLEENFKQLLKVHTIYGHETYQRIAPIFSEYRELLEEWSIYLIDNYKKYGRKD